jgi:hypothetical protein
LPGYLRKGAVAVTGIYLCTTTMGCASFYVNGAKVYDPDPKANSKIWAAADNTGTDANSGDPVSWYKTKWGIIGITAALIIIGGGAGYAIYKHNHDDGPPPEEHHHKKDTYTPPPPPPSL